MSGNNGLLYNSKQIFRYTVDGLAKNLTLNDNASLIWNYDGLRRVSGAGIAKGSDTLSIAQVTSRDASGLVTGLRLGNNTRITQQYETGRPLVKRAEAVRPGVAKPHWKQGLRFDERGDVERMDRPDGERILYTHDALRRLTSATYSGGGAGTDGLAPTYEWEHGQDGRRLSWRHQFGKDTVLYKIGTGMPVEHRLPEGLVRKIEYDYRGNRKIVRTYATSGATEWLREEQMDFDVRDGLRGYTKITRNADGTADTVVRSYVLDERGWRIAELDGDSTVLKKWEYRGNYVAADSGSTDGPYNGTGWKYYNGLGEQPMGVAFVGSNGALEGRWYLTDHLGSVTAVEDSAGERTLSLSLDPWGNLEVAKGGEGVGYAYTGKQLDALLGGSDHGARMLDNRMGMWWGRDPMKQFWNVWSYGSPLIGIDVDGMEETVYIVFAGSASQSDIPKDFIPKLRDYLDDNGFKNYAIEVKTTPSVNADIGKLDPSDYQVNVIKTKDLDLKAANTIDKGVLGNSRAGSKVGNVYIDLLKKNNTSTEGIINTTVHEMLHSWGVGLHHPDPENIMYWTLDPSIPNIKPLSEPQKRIIPNSDSKKDFVQGK